MTVTIRFNGLHKLRSRKWGHPDGIDQGFFLLSKHAKEINHFTIDVIVCLYGRGITIE